MDNDVDINVNIKEITLIKFIGSGSFGDVYSAKWANKYGNKTIAVKMIKQPLDSDQNLKREIIILSCLKHPNIVTLYGISKDHENKFHILLEYAECGSLNYFLHSKKHENDQISYTGKLNWMLQCAKGVAYLHEKNIIHRDLKSDNILLFDNYRILKLCDFGTVKEISTTNTANTGTVNYMAPEVAISGYYDTKCDVYSFGIIFWEVMTRKKPFSHLGKIPPLTLQNKVSLGDRPDLKDIKDFKNSNHIRPIIKNCWDQDPKKRPTMKGLAFTLGIDPSLFSNRPELIALVRPLPEINVEDFQFQ
ncbi:mitogen-activated protein kinase kinase kinase 7-like [Drosophila innubila]|uniref:mitogen-activated protein kinase kinase kinase 7-like n=1 Tax=Drosophila innubila TaxID=198719 RepID=UPI00148E9076|nr:mitogen-activated protein kinase kinase kinase 7-like [Drosophila innubila]